MVRKAPVVLFAVFAVATILAGCGGGENKTEEGGAPGDDEPKESGTASSGSASEGGGETTGGQEGLQRVQEGQVAYGTSFVNPLVEILGEVRIGEGSFVAGNTVLNAAEGRTVEIGNQTNAQDNVSVNALAKESVVRNQTSLAHHATIEDSEIGDFAFVGFNAEIRNSTLEDGAFVLHGARVENVTIPENGFVRAGQVVDEQAEADALPEAEEATEEFRREVLAVNEEFAAGYIELHEEEGDAALTGVGPNPETSFNDREEPDVPDNARLADLVRIVGDVRLGENSNVGERTAIRADEGAPIVIGENADIEERVTFHALKETEIEIGDRLTAGDGAVLHGPLEVGDNLRVGDDAVVFRVRVGDDVTVGQGAVVAGPASEDGNLELEIPDGTNIPDGAVITDQEELDALLEQQEE